MRHGRFDCLSSPLRSRALSTTAFVGEQIKHPTATRDLMTAGIIGFAWAVTSEKGYVRCCSMILVVLISPNTSAPTAGWIFLPFEFDYKHTQGTDQVSALSPGLGGRRKCWYTLWSWRPKPSHSCQMSWGQRSREDILHVLQLIWPAEFILAPWPETFAWETAQSGKVLHDTSETLGKQRQKHLH